MNRIVVGICDRFRRQLIGPFHLLHSKYVVQIIVHSHFDLVSSILALETNKKKSDLRDLQFYFDITKL